MNNPYKRRRFYSEKLPFDVTRKSNKDNPIPDFTLPESPKISNLELIQEVDDFQLDSGDIFSDFLGLEEPIDKQSFFEQYMKTGKNDQEDSFELEIASREQNQSKQINSSDKKNSNQKQSKIGKEEFPLLEENMLLEEIPKNKKLDEIETKLNSGGKNDFFSNHNSKFEIDCPAKKKLINEMFSFKVDVKTNNLGNRNRSQSYSFGHSNSIFDFLNRK
jgi:hypothetical protein